MAAYILSVCPVTPARPRKRVERFFLVAVAIFSSLAGTGMQDWVRRQLGDGLSGDGLGDP